MSAKIHRNLKTEELVKKILLRGEGMLSKTGAVVVYTGKYTGRSPYDRFIVDSPKVHKEIDWGKANQPINEEKFDKLHQKIIHYLSDRQETFVFDGFVCADPEYKLPIRIVSEYAYQSLFARHLFINPTVKELKSHKPQLMILAAPGCLSDPKVDGVNSEVFIVLHLEKSVVLIGGSKYCGEIKKSVFSFLNYYLPQKGVFPMHCSANVSKDGNSALFFGLSGTGKTTLSADSGRKLVGDDEHGWSSNGIFNFEGGCYAKCIYLKKENEPQIFSAIRDGAVVENVIVKSSGELDFDDGSITENTRAAYPLTYIKNSVPAATAGHPKTVFFLSADALGVLPPVAVLDEYSAMYYFLSGYTSKLAGTERGIITPVATFSVCFGAPFMPRPPMVYADLLRKYINKYKTTVYLVNTGWYGGPYGIGERFSIKDTRNIITAIVEGKIDGKKIRRDEIFNLQVPLEVPGVDSHILNPRNLWQDKNEYDRKAKELAGLFVENFRKFKNIPKEVIAAGPKATA